MKIGVFTCIGQNGANYANILYHSLEKYKKQDSNNKIIYNQIINGLENKESPYWNTISKCEFEKPNYSSVGDAGTHNHCLCLNQIYPYILNQDYDYIIISDCDVIMKYQNWDEWIIEQFKNNLNLGILGVEYHPNDYRKGCHYQHFPSVFFLAIPNNIFIQTNIQFLYDPDIYLIINDDDLSKYYGVPIGSKIVKDTGYNLPLHFMNYKYEFLTITYQSHPSFAHS